MAIGQPNVKAGASGGGGSNPTDQSVQRTRNVIQETLVELKKTTWPTREEALRLTGVVIAVIVALGIYMGALDAILSFLVSKFSLLK